jgi:hypothetical protein
MEKVKIVSLKIPEGVYKELLLRIPEEERSNFIRDAILEKLQKTPKPDKLVQLGQRMDKMESEFSELRKYLADLDFLTYEQGKASPHTFGIDDTDHKIIEYLVHYKGATTSELAEYMKTNRWFILNRLRRIQKISKKQLGKPMLDFYPGEKSGKKKAWWINEELIEK